MSRKKALLASSLAICSASAAWAMGTDSHSAYADHAGKVEGKIEPLQITARNPAQILQPISLVVSSLTNMKSKPILYEVKKGDTLCKIGLLFQLPYQEIANKNGVQNPRLLQIGRELNIPLRVKLVVVKSGDSFNSMVNAYHTTPELLLYLNPSLQESKTLSPGMLISVPEQLSTMRPVLAQKSKQKVIVSKTSIKKPQKKKSTAKVFSAKTGTAKFIWPVDGKITSKFGWRNGRAHKGIDIWSPRKSNELIYAVAGGRVVKAGYSGAYGNLVVIDHGNGWETYYAHLSRITVGKGDRVSQGQKLGNMGQTGNATGYHLHFEIRRDGSTLNPLKVLP